MQSMARFCRTLVVEEVTENPETDAQFAETLQELLEDGEAHWF